eukprot:5287722-Ditylum_brightwellii.AAC.1
MSFFLVNSPTSKSIRVVLGICPNKHSKDIDDYLLVTTSIYNGAANIMTPNTAGKTGNISVFQYIN